MRVLITGSHGFVGSNLVDALSSEHEIIRWDIRSDDELPECDVVIHLAGKAHDTKNVSCEEAYYEVNTELTIKIYDSFLKSAAKKFIFCSSIKAQDGDSAYAKSKKAAEEYICGKFRDEYLKFSDKKVYILRPCMIHGKGMKGNLPLLFKLVKKGLPWPLAAFENKRSFASIGNVVYIVDRLLSSEVKSGTYNVCDDDAVSTNDLIGLICECLGEKARLWRIPQGVMKGIAKTGDLLHLPLNTERLGKLTENYIVDNRKIKQALGIEKMPTDANEGLRESIGYLIKEQK